MKKLVLFITCITIVSSVFSQNLYKAVSGDISFFSKTPMEDIDAVNKDVKALINTKTGEVAFIATNVGFHFEKPLMEEHFNENYMESDKYKVSVFKGKIQEKINYNENGKHKVTVKGMINIHGVEQEREITGEVVIEEGEIKVMSEFIVKVKDHKIKIPKLVVKNIAEEVNVTVSLNFELKK
ncbi:MAG: YceI family protein [Vicingaceae bacterium]|nr:YceI family protein [Vicingaceae bacterium]